MLCLLEHMYHELGLVAELKINPIILRRWLVREEEKGRGGREGERKEKEREGGTEGERQREGGEGGRERVELR